MYPKSPACSLFLKTIDGDAERGLGHGWFSRIRKPDTRLILRWPELLMAFFAKSLQLNRMDLIVESVPKSREDPCRPAWPRSPATAPRKTLSIWPNASRPSS